MFINIRPRIAFPGLLFECSCQKYVKNACMGDMQMRIALHSEPVRAFMRGSFGPCHDWISFGDPKGCSQSRETLSEWRQLLTGPIRTGAFLVLQLNSIADWISVALAITIHHISPQLCTIRHSPWEAHSWGVPQLLDEDLKTSHFTPSLIHHELGQPLDNPNSSRWRPEAWVKASEFWVRESKTM